MAGKQHREVETVERPPAAEPRAPGGRSTPPETQRVVLDPMMVVPLVDQQEAGQIYDASILRFGALGGMLDIPSGKADQVTEQVQPPLGAAQIQDFNSSDLSGTKLRAVLRDTENKYRSANLTLRQEGEAWKIVVSSSAVDRYAAFLKKAN